MTEEKLYVIKWLDAVAFSDEDSVQDMIYYYVDWEKSNIKSKNNNKNEKIKKKKIIYVEFPFATDNVDNKLLKKTNNIEDATYMTYDEANDKYNELKELSFIPKSICIEYLGPKKNRFELMDI